MPPTVPPASKIAVVSKVAAALVADWENLPDKRIATQLIAEGIRKVHDHAESHRGRGKYKGQAHWSRDALKVLSTHQGNVRDASLELSHEHIFPVNELITLLRRVGRNATPEACASIINKYSGVAIITRLEDELFRTFKLRSAMPLAWDGVDLWARYKAVGLYEHITDA